MLSLDLYSLFRNLAEDLFKIKDKATRNNYFEEKLPVIYETVRTVHKDYINTIGTYLIDLSAGRITIKELIQIFESSRLNYSTERLELQSQIEFIEKIKLNKEIKNFIEIVSVYFHFYPLQNECYSFDPTEHCISGNNIIPFLEAQYAPEPFQDFISKYRKIKGSELNRYHNIYEDLYDVLKFIDNYPQVNNNKRLYENSAKHFRLFGGKREIMNEPEEIDIETKDVIDESKSEEYKVALCCNAINILLYQLQFAWCFIVEAYEKYLAAKSRMI